MEKEGIGLTIESQRKFFATGKTFDIKYRIEVLKKLRSLVIVHEKEIVATLWQDLHKPEFEVIGTETRLVIKELNLAIRKLRKWSKPRRVYTPIVHLISHSFIAPQPYGQVLILSPWNFPFLLAFMPLVGAIAAGNCVILKVSRQVPNIITVMEKILSHFPQELVAMTNGDHSISEYLLEQKFDYIFFTGSCRIGKYVMQKAAENLIPVSLELGGKNPCVIAADARLDFAAKRIAWGKFLNSGQTCISPDYILIDKKVKDRFLELISGEIRSFYGDNPEKSDDFARVINSENVQRLSELMKCGQIVTGGITDAGSRYVSPTIIKDVKPGDPIMQEEIFGPVLPVIDFENFEDVYSIIEQNPKPLSTYIFTRNKKLIREFMRRTRSGNAAVNETVLQIASPFLPYGGVGSSGMGRYHGKSSFDTFSNLRSVLVKSNLFDIPVRYPPYSRLKAKILTLLIR
ncbi:MAG: aldehyde dehydrogenase family protein [Bacteroidales bacterium]|jgi:aldehyde dehydrogenase (NAD+)